MGLDLDKLRKNLEQALSELSQEDIDIYFPKSDIPKGWVSIDDYLPYFIAGDIDKGYSEYKVRYNDDTESITAVCDPEVWYHYAKNIGITHWFNK